MGWSSVRSWSPDWQTTLISFNARKPRPPLHRAFGRKTISYNPRPLLYPKPRKHGVCGRRSSLAAFRGPHNRHCLRYCWSPTPMKCARCLVATLSEWPILLRVLLYPLLVASPINFDRILLGDKSTNITLNSFFICASNTNRLITCITEPSYYFLFEGE